MLCSLTAFLYLHAVHCTYSVYHCTGPLLHEAAVAGVQIMPYHCRLDPLTATVQLLGLLPFVDTYANPTLDSTDTVESTGVKGKRKRTKKVEDKNATSIMDMTTEG